MLDATGFGPSWRTWLENLLCIYNTFVYVNGSLSSYVRYQHGLRQGYLFSPFLFILVADVLSTIFLHDISSRVLFGVLVGKHRSTCHLQYADDLIILTARGKEDLRIIKLILSLFEDISGLTFMI